VREAQDGREQEFRGYDFVAVGSGVTHTLALKNSGKLVAWHFTEMFPVRPYYHHMADHA